jgi:hypothetical protein
VGDLLAGDLVLRSTVPKLISTLSGPTLVWEPVEPPVGEPRTAPLRESPRLIRTLSGLTRLGDDEFRVISLVGPSIRPAVADLLIGISADEGSMLGFALFSPCSVADAKLAEGMSEDGRIVGVALDRIMVSGLILGLSRVTATGSKVGSDGTTFIMK